MLICRTAAELRAAVRARKAKGQSVGLVPTMGALHEGHLSLVRAARAHNDFLIASIFVNPTQFVQGEDFDQYPRGEELDMRLLERERVDAVYAPSGEEIYPPGFSTYVGPPSSATGWCGDSRPGHFRGVCTVVSILFNHALPDRAYFGRKDAQQLAVIRRLARDLGFPVEIIGLPTVREPDGLAMSSRNAYLTPDQRQSALVLNEALARGVERFRQGETRASAIVEEAVERIESTRGVRLDYAAVVEENTFLPMNEIQRGHLFIGAVYVGETRLIDNRPFE